jgi:hypothetical protein
MHVRWARRDASGVPCAVAAAAGPPELASWPRMIPVRVTQEFMYLRRPVLVAVSLTDLRGPASGIVELPLHLF